MLDKTPKKLKRVFCIVAWLRQCLALPQKPSGPSTGNEGKRNPVLASLDPDENVFFKVVALKAGNLRTVKSNRKRLDSGDIAVTIHEGETCLDSGEVVVNSLPSIHTDSGQSAVHILSMLGFGVSKLTKICKWKRAHNCQYMLPHFSSPQAIQVVARFFAEGALEGKEGVLKVQGDSYALPILNDMEFEGWVHQFDGGWQLSKPGIKQLQVAHSVRQPQSIQDLAITDDRPTSLSLLVKLQNKGWVWEKLPSKKSKRKAEPYALGGPKLFYSSTNTVRLEYLMCLDQAEDVLSEGHLLHHGKKPAYYQKILDKDFDGALQFLGDLEEREQIEDGVVEEEEDGTQGRIMIADQGMSWEQISGVGQEEHVLEDVAIAGFAGEERFALDDVPEVGIWAEASEDGGEEFDIELDEPPAVASSCSHAGPSAPGSGPTASESTVPESSAGISRAVQPETLVDWGTGPQKFRITWRRPGKDVKFGAWQGTLNVQDATDASRTHCLRMIQHWLVSATLFDKAWKHSNFNPRAEETPPYETLLERSEGMEVPETVKADDDDDADDAASPASPGPSVGPKAKAKPKVKTTSKGKSKPKPKPKSTKAKVKKTKKTSGGKEESKPGSSSDSDSSDSDSDSSSSSSSSSSD